MSLLIRGVLFLIVVSLYPNNISQAVECEKGEIDMTSQMADQGSFDYVDNPTVNITIPVSETEEWFFNDTYVILQNVDVQVSLFCIAPYPIQWIEIYGPESNGFETDPKTLYNERIEDREGFDSEEPAWVYHSLLQLKFKGQICSESNFTCQSVVNPCFQTNVLTTVDKVKDVVTFRVTDDNDQSISENNSQKEIDSRNGKEECPVILWYSTKEWLPGWKCEKTQTGQQITEKSEISNCDSAAHCNTFFHHQRRGKKCLRKLKEHEVCFHCAYLKQENAFFKPGFVTCRDKGVLLAQHYFHSVPQTFEPNEVPDIYFDWADADPQKMMMFEPLPSETYLGDNITIFCQVSRYYFAYGHRFGLEDRNGTLKFEEPSDGVWIEIYNVNRMNLTVELNDVNLKRIYCFAPVWNSTQWVNKSQDIYVRQDSAMPDILESEDERNPLIVYKGQINLTIICEGVGKPTPTVTWVQTVKTARFSEVNGPGPSTTLTFPLVNSRIDGDYICEVENFLGTKRKTFEIIVVDPFKLVITTAVLVTGLVVLLCLIAMTLCWRKIKAQRKEIRLLTEAEIKEFMDGNIEAVQANDYLDTSDLIQSLPYNPKFEIPKEMIHIDTSMVLGSGNFGQVLKGSIQVLNNHDGKRIKNDLTGVTKRLASMSSIEVAVKTVKHNMEVLYFKTLLSEVKIMAYIGKHTNIVTLVGACTQNIRKREIYIAVEFCTHGSMEHFLRKYRKSFINLVKDDLIYPQPEKINPYQNVEEGEENLEELHIITTHHLIKWSREIANGLEFLGSKKIIHGDLAARNIFLSKDLIAKIGDFGLSRQLLEYSNYIKTHECPLPWKWMAVESLQDMKFSVHSDIWAYGVTIWEIFTLANTPYPGISWSMDFLDQLNNGMRMHKPSYATSKIYNIMLDCWSLEPLLRPSFKELKTFFEHIISEMSPQDYFEPKFPSPCHSSNVTVAVQKENRTPVATVSVSQTVNEDPAIPIKDSNLHLNLKISREDSVMTIVPQDDTGYLIPLSSNINIAVLQDLALI